MTDRKIIHYDKTFKDDLRITIESYHGSNYVYLNLYTGDTKLDWLPFTCISTAKRRLRKTLKQKGLEK